MNMFATLDAYRDSVAVVDRDRHWTFGEVITRGEEIAEPLGARALVFLETDNSIEALSAYMGCLRAGHAVHLFGDLSDDRLVRLCDVYQPNFIVRPGNGDVLVERLCEARAKLHPDLQILLSTSGSTGSPKLVKLSHSGVASNARSIAQYLGLTVADRSFTTLKFNYSYGMSVINAHWLVGASIALSELSVVHADFWSAFADSGATNFAGVPYTFEMLALDDKWASITGLRFATQAGGRLSPDLVRKMAELGRAHGWDFFVMYGQTEAGPRIAYLPPPLALTHADFIGRAIPGGELSLVGNDGAAIVAPHTPGELRFAGPSVMMGYALDASGLASDETPSFLLTGDIATVDEQGLFKVIGRSSRFIKPFGLRVNLDEFQDLARGLVPDAICTGSDERIVVATTAPVSADLPGRLAALVKLPAQLLRVVRVDDIPKLPSGKIDYRTIIALGEAEPERTEPGVAQKLRLAARLAVSPAFYRRAIVEAGIILGLIDGDWHNVRTIYQAFTGGHVDGGSSFRSLAGDSLSYVQASLALEGYLGVLPEDWDVMSVDELEELRSNEAVF